MVPLHLAHLVKFWQFKTFWNVEHEKLLRCYCQNIFFYKMLRLTINRTHSTIPIPNTFSFQAPTLYSGGLKSESHPYTERFKVRLLNGSDLEWSFYIEIFFSFYIKRFRLKWTFWLFGSWVLEWSGPIKIRTKNGWPFSSMTLLFFT